MNEESKKRLARSIRATLSSLDNDAKCFGYANEPEFQELKDYLITTANTLNPDKAIPRSTKEKGGTL